MNSPQSQKLAVGSLVIRYTTAEIKKTIQPVMMLARLNVFMDNSFEVVLLMTNKAIFAEIHPDFKII